MQKIKTSSIVFETLNASTHGLGVIFSIIAIIFLTRKGISLNSYKVIATYFIYGISMLLLFLSSTLYHSFVFSKYAVLFQKIDHSTIYIFIAGSYTPYLLLSISGKIGIICSIIVWSLAITGILFEVITLNKYPKISLIFYLVLGWFVLLVLPSLINSLKFYGLILLILGGISYSVGAIFYAFKKYECFHLLWHIFVILGALFMFFSILHYV
ncbi:MAG: hemolysin III family protein [Fusobacterium sp.]|nr:hemolysin III family protein [Fusobacterium sp.]